MLWWSWGGYAWLTSVVDPEEGAVRIVIFAAMAALLVAALSVPGAFDDDALAFALAYGIVRIAHIALFLLASRRRARAAPVGDRPRRRHDDRRQPALVASATDGGVQAAPLDASRSLLDMGLPYLFWAEGWQLVPAHFAERHGLILIIALGESIVAIGVGSNAVVDVGVVVAATLGIAIAAALWWIYFDVTVWVAERRLSEAEPGGASRTSSRATRTRTCTWRWWPGIVLLALGMKKTLEHVGDPLETVPAVALVGGVATYLLALVAFRWRLLHTLSRPRTIAAVAAARPPAARARGACLRDGHGARRRPLRGDRLRGRPVRRVPRPHPARARPRQLGERGGHGVSEKLWAPWRLEYVADAGRQETCVFCDEAAGKLGDESLVVARGERAFVLLNKFPYSSGHLMVATVRHVAELADLEPDEVAELHALAVAAIEALRRVYGPDAFNVGLNLGAVAGGSISGHLHQHVVPRWAGDTNFMPVLADVKVVPEHLVATRGRLREAWPV